MIDYKSKVLSIEPTARIDVFSRLKPVGRKGFATFEDRVCVLINKVNCGEGETEQKAWLKAYKLLSLRNKSIKSHPSPTLETPQNTGGNAGEGEGEQK